MKTKKPPANELSARHIVWFCSLLWRVVTADVVAAETLAWMLAIAVVVILMLPETRLETRELLEAIRAWKSSPDKKL